MNTKQVIFAGIGASTIAGGAGGVYYLSQDKTIKDRLISQGNKLIEKDEEYQTVFKEFKSTDSYINLIKGDNSTLSADSELNIGGQALKKWCEDNLKLSLTDENIKKSFENSKKYCTKPALTIEEKISKNNKKLVGNWEQKLNSLKNPPDNGELLGDLKTLDNTIIALTDAGNKVKDTLKNWCEKHIKTKLIEDKTNVIWGKIEKRCVEPITG